MPPPTDLDLRDLTLPLEDTATVRRVLNGYLRALLRAFTSLPGTALREPTRTLHALTLRAAQQHLRADPRRVVLPLRSPTLGAVLCTLQRHLGPDADRAYAESLTRELCLLLWTEFALAGLVPAEGQSFPRGASPWPALRSPASNFVLAPGEAVTDLVFRPEALVLRTQEADFTVDLRDPVLPAGAPATLSRPYHRIVDGVWLAVSDNNPLSHFEAHPDKQGNAIDLGGHPAEEWVAVLRRAFDLVDAHLPLLGEEMRLVLRTIVPVGWHEQRHLSASYQEAIGTVYMTLHPNEMTMVEALIHEFQHNKLNAAFHLDGMLHNAFSPLYSSPVRPDPRPLHGVVLAVHAFQPVARLYEAMSAARHPLAESPVWQRRFRDIIRMNRAGADTVLSHARPTPGGGPLFAEMRALDEHFRAYESATWPDEATSPVQALPE
jgi:HEXXH motif-containing protein